VEVGKGQLEARPSKKRKVGADKGKRKAKKVKSEPEFRFWEVMEAIQELRGDMQEFWMKCW